MRRLRRFAKRVLRGADLYEMAVERGMKVGRNVQVQRGVQFDVSHAWLIEIGDLISALT